MKKHILLLITIVALNASAQNHPAWQCPGSRCAGISHRTGSIAAPTTQQKSETKSLVVRNFPYREGFENGLRGWLTADADTDGRSWTTVSGYGVAYAGQGVALSASYDIEEGELTPDNWLISPSIVMPQSGDLSLVWMASALDTLNYEEHYTVYVSLDGDSNIASFQTQLFSETLNGRGYVCRTVDLSPYAGRTIRIAFRHHDCTDQSALMLDGLRIHQTGWPVVAIYCPAYVYAGDTTVLRAVLLSGSGLTSYSWQIDGIGNGTGNSIRATWDSVGTYNMRLIGTYGNGYDTAYRSIRVIDCTKPLTLPFTETFDIGLGCWYLTERDRWHWVWLVSQAIAVPATGDYELSWSVLPYEPLSNRAVYEVYVSTNGNAVSDFTTPSFSETLQPTAVPVRRVLSLSQWAGDTIYVAMRHKNLRDVEGLEVRSIEATAATAPEVEIEMPVTARSSQRVRLVAKVVSSLPITNCRWSCEGITAPTMGDTVYVQWPSSAAGRKRVIVTVQTAAGTATDTGYITISACEDHVSTFPYHEPLDESLGCWEPLDGNNDGRGWESVRGMIARLDADTTLAGHLIRRGNDAAISWSYYPYSYHDGFWGNAVLSDNYLVSPALHMPDAENPQKLSFFARSYGAPTYTDSVEVKVATTKPTHARDFTRTIMPLQVVADQDYKRIVVDLAEFAGQTIYLGILHYTMGGMALVIDDIEIATDFEGIEAPINTQVHVYPNPTDGRITLSENALQVEVFSCNGHLVTSKSNVKAIDLSNHPAGIYIARIVTPNGMTMQKIIKR
ncbi:MAG: choice-of-anchor J domain-containing protein [Bacteroidales bacterium]|nr:choice-of-anchor J domain-containing protein [Bacteroidales bacterium]